MKKKIYLPLIALIVGIASALLAFKFHSLFYVLVPIWALALGYFTSWRWGLLYGFLLFSGYTVTMSFIHNPPGSSIGLHHTLPYDYFVNFILGGFSLVLIGGLASVIRKKGIKHIASISVVLLLVVTVGYCSYTSLPRYEYSYTATVHSSYMGNIKAIYLPVPTINNETNTEILEHPVLSRECSLDLVKTEHGLMLRISQLGLTGGYLSLEFEQEGASYQIAQLMPKYEGETENMEGEPVTAFIAPLKFSTSGDVGLTIEVSTTIRTETNVNFYNFKTVYYSDRLEYEGIVIDDEWVMAEGQTGKIYKTRVSGASGY
jgi:hypothetical protein